MSSAMYAQPISAAALHSPGIFRHLSNGFICICECLVLWTSYYQTLHAGKKVQVISELE